MHAHFSIAHGRFSFETDVRLFADHMFTVVTWDLGFRRLTEFAVSSPNAQVSSSKAKKVIFLDFWTAPPPKKKFFFLTFSVFCSSTLGFTPWPMITKVGHGVDVRALKWKMERERRKSLFFGDTHRGVPPKPREMHSTLKKLCPWSFEPLFPQICLQLSQHFHTWHVL